MTRLTTAEEGIIRSLRKKEKKKSKNKHEINIMAIATKKHKRTHFIFVWTHFRCQKNLKHVHEDVEKLGGKIDKVYWVLLDCSGNCCCLCVRKDVWMKLSPNFSVRELTKSQTAERKGIDNTPTEEHIENLKLLCENILQPNS